MILYHVSLDVADLGVAMVRLGDDLGLTWRPVIEGRKVTVDDHGAPIEYRHRLVYSVEGPPAVELCESAPGTRAPGDEAIRQDHAGFWVDDLVGEWHRLQGEGWVPLGDAGKPGWEPKGAAMLISPYGLKIEIVDVSVDRPRVADLYPVTSPFHRPRSPVATAAPSITTVAQRSSPG
jgi:hypothetical protein